MITQSPPCTESTADHEIKIKTTKKSNSHVDSENSSTENPKKFENQKITKKSMCSVCVFGFKRPDRPKPHFKISAVVQYQGEYIKIQALIDTGATTNLVHPSVISALHIPQVPRRDPIGIEMVDGTPITSGDISHHSESFCLIIGDHREWIALDICSIGNHDLILGLPWLQKHGVRCEFHGRAPVLEFHSPFCQANCMWPTGTSWKEQANAVSARPQSSRSVQSRAPLEVQRAPPQTSSNIGGTQYLVPRPRPKVPIPYDARTSASSKQSSVKPGKAISGEVNETHHYSSSQRVESSSVKHQGDHQVHSRQTKESSQESNQSKISRHGYSQTVQSSSSQAHSEDIKVINISSFRTALKKSPVNGILTYADSKIQQVISNVGSLVSRSVDSTMVNDKELEELKSKVPKEFHKYLQVFVQSNAEKLPQHTLYDHAIVLEGDAQPKFGPIYPLSAVELKALDEYLQKNLANGFIRPSTSSAGSPILFVKKSDGSLRLCVDYRQLNKITRKNRYPLPLIHENLDRLQEATIFTKLDLAQAYHQIRIKEGDEWKTAFRTRYGLFEYQVMPFGLTNAPASFQNLINDVLRDLLDHSVIVYMDDILIFSKDKQQHVKDVIAVLERLSKNNLWAKAEKCEFFKDEIGYLGFLVSSRGTRMDPEKVKSVAEWQTPKNVHDIQVFLGFANFYRHFIKNFSKITSPITALLKKGNTFKWSEHADQAFKTLKDAFSSAPVLTHFKPGEPIVLETDASDFAIAGVISHPGDKKKLHPIAYFSRKLQPPELNYEIYDKELLAIVECFKHWRAYLEGTQEITVYTDHKNLEYFTVSKVLNRRQARWSELLANFNFKICYRSGSKMGKPDALSRRSEFREGSKAAEAPARTLIKPSQWIVSALNTTSGPSSDIVDQIKILQTQDSTLEALLPYLKDQTLQVPPELNKIIGSYSLHDDLVYFGNLLYVPNDQKLKLDLLQQVHNSPTAGHYGQAKTYELLCRNFYFPGAKNFVNTYVNGCHTCRRNKTPRHKPYGPLQSLPIPSQPWKSISMDAIVELPVSNGYDSIMVFVDRLTKQAHFVPYTSKGFGVKQLAKMFRQNIVRLHGLPADIVSDRGSLFTSHLWRSLLDGMNIKPNFSTAFHPQSDGQTERVNQVLEGYLRTYCNYDQNNWSDLLDLAEFTYNNSVHTTTKLSPFEANYGFNPLDPSSVPRVSTNIPAAVEHLEKLRSLQAQLKENIRAAQEKHAKYYDRHKLDITDGEDHIFQVGDLVFLNRKNIKTARPSLKLDYRMLGPYKIIEATSSPLAFKLDLPPSMGVHPVFHVSLLEPVQTGHPGQPQDPPPHVVVDGEIEYFVERIIDSREGQNGKYEYLVKWQGYSDEHDSWEPWEGVKDTAAYRSFRRIYSKDPLQRFPTREENRNWKPKRRRSARLVRAVLSDDEDHWNH